jgi:SpoVK/Ycf46/Vps4 family AAA+-type ATPase
MLCISEEELLPGRALARSYSKKNAVQQPAARAALERFVGAYQAVQLATASHDAGVYVGAAEGRSALKVKPATMRRQKYPEAPGLLLTAVDNWQPETLAGYFSYLMEEAEQRVQRAAVPAAISVMGRTYVLHKPVLEERLVGLEREQQELDGYVRKLFNYNSSEMDNTLKGTFPRTILLSGPPGTGKSSLLKAVFAVAARLERLTGTRLSREIYDASSFSSYFGKSTRILKNKLSRVADPSGVGIFCIEDADMVLQSREDEHAFHGVLELQQYLMNHLSGLEPYYGNTLTFLTTNRPADLEEALLSRVQQHFIVNPFEQVATHEAYFGMHLPTTSPDELSALARDSHAQQYTGRDLERIMLQARTQNTPAPTDEQLLRRERCEQGAITPQALRQLIAAARKVPPRS